MLFSLAVIVFSAQTTIPVVQGETAILQLTHNECRMPLVVFDRTYHCRPDHTVIVGIDFLQGPGPYGVTLDGNHFGTIAVFPRVQPALEQFRSRATHCPPRQEKRCEELRKRRAREVQRFGEAMRSGPLKYPELLVDSEFANPLTKIFTTSSFGQPRRYGKAPQLQWHPGVDLRTKRPLPVTAVGAGVALFTERMMLEGKIVVVYHGNGVYSLYLHLSKFKVSPGELVYTGDVIGLSGDSGAEGQPHLHFAMKVYDKVVDPLACIEKLN